MSGELREVVSVDGKEEEPEPSTSFDGDHSESGRSQTIGEDPVNHIERTVSPTPPTIEELEQSLSRPRYCLLHTHIQCHSEHRDIVMLAYIFVHAQMCVHVQDFVNYIQI